MAYIIVAKKGNKSRVINRYKNRNIINLPTKAKATKMIKDYKARAKQVGYSTKGISFKIKKI